MVKVWAACPVIVTLLVIPSVYGSLHYERAIAWFDFIEARNIGAMKNMLLKKEVSVNQLNYLSRTGLHVVAEKGASPEGYKYVLVADFLLKNGVDVNAIDLNQETALQIANRFQSWAISKLIIKSGACPGGAKLADKQKLNVNHQDKFGWTALYWLVGHDKIELIKDILELDLEPNFNLPDKQGQTVFHMVKSLEMLNLLTQAGAPRCAQAANIEESRLVDKEGANSSKEGNAPQDEDEKKDK